MPIEGEENTGEEIQAITNTQERTGNLKNEVDEMCDINE